MMIGPHEIRLLGDGDNNTNSGSWSIVGNPSGTGAMINMDASDHSGANSYVSSIRLESEMGIELSSAGSLANPTGRVDLDITPSEYTLTVNNTVRFRTTSTYSHSINPLWSSSDVVARNATTPISMGAWPTNTAHRGVWSDSGYLLLGRTDGNTECYLRTTTGSNLHLGVNSLNVLTFRGTDGLAIFNNYIADTNMPATGATSGFQAVYRSTTSDILHRFTSKREIKENITPVLASDSGAIIDGLIPVTFNEKVQAGDTEEAKAWRAADKQYGFIAEDVFEVADGHLSTIEVVDGDIVPNGWAVHNMVAVLVAEVKALRARVLVLENG
jgi:hypothetical protein